MATNITIASDEAFPVRLDFDGGVHMISTLDETAVAMSVQDARELQAKLRKALTRYDREQHEKQTRADWLRWFADSKPKS